ncbi:sperm flagellar protein 1 [Cynoglossus semilaevis]|uniref:Sperm flagellar 1 n=1 Tax=Cynoglossus semilaevis TaxID=244447 RepID=A0A3P8VHI3_CYNSE|nr:sperm flagellar protein 1 [Cynoglossus semilaevis]XP_016893024.1 sperm flagellar protein 1 [Cynoglossus semilaevis]
MSRELSDGELRDLYSWVDKIPLSRPKRHITRDFSDGVMAAEVVKHFFPKLVDLHNYVPAFSRPQKLSNWGVLNRKVFAKLNFNVPEETVKKIVMSSPGVIEPVLSDLKEKIEFKLENGTENTLGSELSDIRKFDKNYTELHQSGAVHNRGDMKKDDTGRLRNNHMQHTVQFHTDMDPVVRIILQEKEQSVTALQETVEILQLKVSKLEHLLHLKDMRIEELTQHLDMYKSNGKKQ